MKTLITLLILCLVYPLFAQDMSLQQAIELYRQGKDKEAKKVFDALRNDPVAKAYRALLLTPKDLDLAEEWIENASNQAPENALVQAIRGRIMGKQAGESIFLAPSYASKAHKSLKAAVELEPDNVGYRKGLMNYYLKAPGIVGGSEKKAKHQADIIDDLNKVEGLKAYIVIAKHRKQPELVETLLRQGIDNFPLRPDFYTELGFIKQAQENFNDARQFFSLATARQYEDKPSRVAFYHALYQLGRTSILSQSNVNEGIAALTRYIHEAPALRELPESHWARFRLANLYSLQGNSEKAKEMYTRLKAVEDKALQKALQIAIQNAASLQK